MVAAPFTPMNGDCTINLAPVEKQAQWLAGNGVTGAFVCGTTGEGASLTLGERKQVAERWQAAAPRDLRVIVHVGHGAIGDCQALAAHAQKIGASAVASIGPTFFRAANVEQLADFCARVAASAPGLPFYYYHIPVMTGIDLPMFDFLKVASVRIPNFAGIKFTHENLMDYARCLNFEGGRFDILFGRDEILLASLAMGATGAVGSTYNYMPAIYHGVMAAFATGDMAGARRCQAKANEVIAIMSRRGGLPAAKAMMKLVGLDCGPARAPLQNLSSDAFASLTRELEAAGFPAQFEKGEVA